MVCIIGLSPICRWQRHNRTLGFEQLRLAIQPLGAPEEEQCVGSSDEDEGFLSDPNSEDAIPAAGSDVPELQRTVHLDFLGQPDRS